MDVEIESLVREAVAAAMRDMRQDGVDIAVVDDMVNANGSQSYSGGEGIDTGGSGMCGAFAFEGGKIKPGGIYRARTFDRIEGADVPENFTGYAAVKVFMGDTEEADSIVFVNTIPSYAADEYCLMPLYKFEYGTIKEDYRGSPNVQMWE